MLSGSRLPLGSRRCRADPPCRSHRTVTVTVAAEVLAVSPSGVAAHQLPLSGTNGATPVAGAIQATNGTLYGTASAQGTDANGNPAYGTVFTIAGLPAK